MASLIDIGKSGLQSYRQALTVTGQNIANINTDGYKRRAADLEEVITNQGVLQILALNLGLGSELEISDALLMSFCLIKQEALLLIRRQMKNM